MNCATIEMGAPSAPCSRITSSWAAIYQNTNIALLKSDTLMAVIKAALQSSKTVTLKNYNFSLFDTINTDSLTDIFSFSAGSYWRGHIPLLIPRENKNIQEQVFILLYSLSVALYWAFSFLIWSAETWPEWGRLELLGDGYSRDLTKKKKKKKKILEA